MAGAQLLVTFGLSLALASGCNDDDSPSELLRAQVLAVRSEPPQLRAGERGRVRLLIGDSMGAISEVDPATMTATTPSPLATVVQENGGWFVVAGDQATIDAARQALGLDATAPVPFELQTVVTIEGLSRVALKTVRLGTSAANPSPPTFTFNGAAPPATGIGTVVGIESQFTAASQGGVGELGYSWYSSVGKLGRYRSPTATLKGKAPATGILLNVVRDTAGGVAWASVAAHVDPAPPQ